MSLNPRQRRIADRFNRSAILKTFIPHLRSIYTLLLGSSTLPESHRGILAKVRLWLRAHPTAEAKDLQRHFCEQAYLEVSGQISGDLFKRFLLWAPKLMPFLETNLDRLRKPGDLSPLACEAIGTRWDAPRNIVAEAIKSRTRRIAPREMRFLILSLSQQQPAMLADVAKVAVTSQQHSDKGRRGPEPLAFEETTMFKVGKRVDDEILRFQTICADLRSLPRRARTNLTRAVELLKAKNYSIKDLEAGIRSPGNPLIAARWFISMTTKRQYNVIAKYHQAYRRAVAKPNHS